MLACITILFYVLGCTAYAADELTVSVNESYTIGGPVLITVISKNPISDASNIKLTIEKPNGTKVETVTRQEAWNKENESFDIYTIDYLGTFIVTATDTATGATGSASFESLLFTMGSTIVFIISVLIFLAALVYLRYHKKSGKVR